AGLHRDTTAPDDAREIVAPEVVGAERMAPRGRLADLAPVGPERIGTDDPRRRHRCHDEREHDHATDDGGRAAPQATPPAMPGRRARRREHLGCRGEARAHAGPPPPIRMRGSSTEYERSTRRLMRTYEAAVMSTTPCTSG